MTDQHPPSILSFEDQLPLHEKKLEEAFSDGQINEYNQSAAEVLTAIISLDQMSYEHVDQDAKGVSSDLQRLEQKIDFVTELLARVLHSQQNIPESRAIRLCADQLFWRPGVSLNNGDYCVLSIYLSKKYPTPLELPVEVIGTPLKDSQEDRVKGRILLSDESVIDDLTRMIFLYHRRRIARNKA